MHARAERRWRREDENMEKMQHHLGQHSHHQSFWQEQHTQGGVDGIHWSRFPKAETGKEASSWGLGTGRAENSLENQSHNPSYRLPMDFSEHYKEMQADRWFCFCYPSLLFLPHSSCPSLQHPGQTTLYEASIHSSPKHLFHPSLLRQSSQLLLLFLLLFLCPLSHPQPTSHFPSFSTVQFICLFGSCRKCHSHTPSSPKVQRDIREQLEIEQRQRFGFCPEAFEVCSAAIVLKHLKMYS